MQPGPAPSGFEIVKSDTGLNKMKVNVVEMYRHPPTSALSPVLDEMLRLHGRLQPHLLRYRQIMSDDQDYTNRVCTLRHCSKSCFALYV